VKAEAPSNSLELADRIARLRQQYAPYLKSLPEPLPPSQRQDLSGDDWYCRDEIADADLGEALDAKDWHRPEAGRVGWSRITVPQWRYNVKETRFSRSVVVWYRKSFVAAPRDPRDRVWLCFHGVDWQAEVFLNGHAIGTHRVYHEPFRFDVTQQLVTGRNTLAVRVTSGPAFDEPAAYWSLFPVPILREGDEGRYVPDRSRSLTNLGQGDSHVGDGYGIHRDTTDSMMCCFI
jgi:beta-galactosidase/beta-glucuronidase